MFRIRMVLIKSNLVYFILLNHFIHSIEELSAAEDNDIAITERIIRDTINNIFASFRVWDVWHKPKIKDFSVTHDFFVSITLEDYDNLKKIARLTRVNTADNTTQHFISLINEVLNDDVQSDEASNDIFVNTYIELTIENLRHLRETYEFNKNLDHDVNLLTNVTKSFKDNVIRNHEFWRPSARRIYQGRKVHIKEFPFMASVLFFKQFQCAGSIIKSDLVITSSSCLQLAWNNRFFRENPAFLSVRIGSDYSQRGGENIPVLEVYFHPQYDPKTLNHNLAIMRLTRRIHFSKKIKNVKKIDIDRNPSPLPVNTECITIIGWGAKDRANVLHHPWANRLTYAELDYYDLLDCQDIYTKTFVTRRHFCAGFISKGGGACNHDAGGPGVANGQLIGVISFGTFSCGAPDSPTVFTKLGYYTDWIETILEQDTPHTYRDQNSLKLPPMNRFTSPKPTAIVFNPLEGEGTTEAFPLIRDIDFLRLLKNGGSLKEIMSALMTSEESDNANTKQPEAQKSSDARVAESKYFNKKTEPYSKEMFFIPPVEDTTFDRITKMDAYEINTNIKKKRKVKNVQPSVVRHFSIGIDDQNDILKEPNKERDSGVLKKEKELTEKEHLRTILSDEEIINIDEDNISFNLFTDLSVESLVFDKFYGNKASER